MQEQTLRSIKGVTRVARLARGTSHGSRVARVERGYREILATLEPFSANERAWFRAPIR